MGLRRWRTGPHDPAQSRLAAVRKAPSWLTWSGMGVVSMKTSWIPVSAGQGPGGLGEALDTALMPLASMAALASSLADDDFERGLVALEFLDKMPADPTWPYLELESYCLRWQPPGRGHKRTHQGAEPPRECKIAAARDSRDRP